MIAGKQREHPAKRMADDGDAFGINMRCGLQESQPGEGVVELAARDQLIMQLLSRFSAPGFSLLQKVLHKWALVGRQTLAPTAQIEERVAVFEKQWSKLRSGLSHRPTSRVLRVVATRPVIE